MPKRSGTLVPAKNRPDAYDAVLAEITAVLEAGRSAAARSVNAVMTATYWETGRRIVEFEQGGRQRAEYGRQLLERLAGDLTKRFGRGFGVDNLQRMRLFYQSWQPRRIYATVSRKSLPGPTSGATGPLPIDPVELSGAFPLSWSHYVKLMTVKGDKARVFYETEALRGGWTVRQLERQIGSQFYERTALSHNKAAMLTRGARPKPEDLMTPEEEIKDPFVLEFLDLKDEYSESDLEEALIHHLETFLLELGGDFTFVGRQKRLRIGNQWFRVDLVFFHRRLRALIIVDLKLGAFTHAAAGQMHLYLNYAREHWTHPDENPPVGLILCAEKDEAVVRYALEGLPNKVLAAEYRTVLPDEETIAIELERTRRLLEGRKAAGRKKRQPKKSR
ncbi:MAG TPA: PDDEXK nuclease domain-containing protein [Blastocatellia bacterium]|nr:PDDEXK nuclease domain-containing protein [Blastocatellia bacterium]